MGVQHDIRRRKQRGHGCVKAERFHLAAKELSICGPVSRAQSLVGSHNALTGPLVEKDLALAPIGVEFAASSPNSAFTYPFPCNRFSLWPEDRGDLCNMF